LIRLPRTRPISRSQTALFAFRKSLFGRPERTVVRSRRTDSLTQVPDIWDNPNGSDNVQVVSWLERSELGMSVLRR
jgi:hypothetical protein